MDEWIVTLQLRDPMAAVEWCEQNCPDSFVSYQMGGVWSFCFNSDESSTQLVAVFSDEKSAALFKLFWNQN